MQAEQPTQLALTIPEVARRLGKTELSVRRAVERGQLPSRRWGRRIIVLASELEQFLQQLPPPSGGSAA
jgi:excisionase family DNA binding protein